MLTYLLSGVVVFITIIIIYIINGIFEELTLTDKKKYNIQTDCIVILTQDACTYCIKLYEMITNSKKKITSKITRITLKSNSTFSFDSVFLDLKLEERDSIIKGVHEMLIDGVILFPTIIHNNKVVVGLPSKITVNNIFEIL